MKITAYGRTFEVDAKRVRGNVVPRQISGTDCETNSGECLVTGRARPRPGAQRAHTGHGVVAASVGTPGSNPNNANRNKPVPNPAPALSSPPLSLCFTLWGQIRGGKNNICITRTGHRYPNKKFEQWRDEMLKQCPAVAGPFTGPLHLIVDYVKGDRLRRDMPAMLDALLHLFGKAGYFVDDSQVVQCTWTPFPLDRKRPRCTVTLSPIDRNLDEEEP